MDSGGKRKAPNQKKTNAKPAHQPAKRVISVEEPDDVHNKISREYKPKKEARINRKRQFIIIIELASCVSILLLVFSMLIGAELFQMGWLAGTIRNIRPYLSYNLSNNFVYPNFKDLPTDPKPRTALKYSIFNKNIRWLNINSATQNVSAYFFKSEDLNNMIL